MALILKYHTLLILRHHLVISKAVSILFNISIAIYTAVLGFELTNDMPLLQGGYGPMDHPINGWDQINILITLIINCYIKYLLMNKHIDPVKGLVHMCSDLYPLWNVYIIQLLSI